MLNIPAIEFSWIALLAIFFGNLLTDGLLYSNSVFIAEFNSIYGADLNKYRIVFIGSTYGGVLYMICPASVPLSKIISERYTMIFGVFLTSAAFFVSFWINNFNIIVFIIGLFGGIGSGLFYNTINLQTSYWFTERFALASGIAATGSSTGAIFFNLVIPKLIEMYTVKGAFLVVAGIFSHGVIISILLGSHRWRRDEVQVNDEQTNDEQTNDEQTNDEQTNDEQTNDEGEIKDLIKSFTFWLIILTTYTYVLSNCTMNFLIVDYIVENKYDLKTAAWVPATWGIVNTISRILNSFLADCIQRKYPLGNVYFYASVMFPLAILYFCLPFMNNMTHFIFYGVLTGYLESVFGCFIFNIVCILLPRNLRAYGFSFMNTSSGVAILSSPIISIFYDYFSSYKLCFFISSSVVLFTGIITMFLPLVHEREF